MKQFNHTGERFADIQMLRYRLAGFSCLSLKQKILVYYLSEATLSGRDIVFDQFGRDNLRLRKELERVFIEYSSRARAVEPADLNGSSSPSESDEDEFRALEVYLKRLWFSSGVHHHYGMEKFRPEFSRRFLLRIAPNFPPDLLELIFNPDVQPKRVSQDEGRDLVLSSSCNYYEGVTQKEAEQFYAAKLRAFEESSTRGSSESLSDNVSAIGSGQHSAQNSAQTSQNSAQSVNETAQVPAQDSAPAGPPSFGLNSKLIKENGEIKEKVWSLCGLYAPAIERILFWLRKALTVSENEQQAKAIRLLIEYYETGDLALFDRYSIEWLKATEGDVDFINGFIEVYGDPLGIKASWEGIVHYKDLEATKRTQKICSNAQWFEDHSPVDPRFRKKEVKGVVANVVRAAMLGGDEYPASAIGINLPNADWIRARYGSKSITISNLTEAYNATAKGNGFLEEFVGEGLMLKLIRDYADACDDLHTDLHECLGHGSCRILDGVDSNALREHASTIEEARADLFALYFMADDKLIELGLLPNPDAYKAQYYTYLLNGLMTQQVRIAPGAQIEEAHMRNRALISRWVMAHSNGSVRLEKTDKTRLIINDFLLVRQLFAQLLAEIQRIKSEGDYPAARHLVETYAIRLDAHLHNEILNRYKALNIAPYKGFLNPRLCPVLSPEGQILDIAQDYSESYTAQMLRYSRDYSFL